MRLMGSFHTEVSCAVCSGPHSDLECVAAKACALRYLGRREKLPSVSRCRTELWKWAFRLGGN